MKRDAITAIVGDDCWKAPRNVVDLNLSAKTLNKKVLIWETRWIVEHPVKVMQGPQFESCGKQIELRGGGQLNLLKVTHIKGDKALVVGDKTPFWQTLMVPDTEDLWFVWIGVPPEAKLQLAAATDWALQRHTSFKQAWADVKNRLRKYPPEMVK